MKKGFREKMKKHIGYLYETHLHTKDGSSCGISSGREYIRKYLDLGYSGIIITDHFYNGNCAVSRSLEWKEWVYKFCKGYENTKEEGLRRGLDVFFGWEETFGAVDYLIYGLDKEWLLEHPESAKWTRKEQFEKVRRYGGCVVQAHPFRNSTFADSPDPSPEYIDAIEAANAGNYQVDDALAWAYAKKNKITVTAGSDIHYSGDIDSFPTFGVYLKEKMETISDYVEAIRSNTIMRLNVPSERLGLSGDERKGRNRL